MPDSGLIDNALVTKLNADAGAGGLTTLMPDGTYFEEAPTGKTRFVIVSLMDESDTPVFEGRGIEAAVYLVKAVALSTAATEATMRSAAARIDALLEGGSLSVAGYSTMTLRRQSRIRLTEVDDVDPSVRWYHRGGQYEVVMST